MAKRKRRNRQKQKPRQQGGAAAAGEADAGEAPASPPPPPPEPHRGGLILTVGVLSLIACPLLGPVAWSVGQGDLDDMRAGAMDARGFILTRVGSILGIIGTVVLFIFLLIGLFAAVMFLVFGRDPFGPLPNG